MLAVSVMGAGAELTTVRLRDRAPGFADPAAPRPVWLTFPGPRWNDGQWLGYQDMTVDTGAGNTAPRTALHPTSSFAS